MRQKNKILGFIKFLWYTSIELIKLKSPYVNRDTAFGRSLTCVTCPLNNNGKCEGCGCIIKYKVKFKKTDCPLGYWR